MNGLTPPTIETMRLWRRPMHTTDFDALLPIFTAPQVMASFGDELFMPAQMQRWLDRNLEHQAQLGYGLFAAIRKTDSLLVGDCGLEQMAVDGQAIIELAVRAFVKDA